MTLERVNKVKFDDYQLFRRLLDQDITYAAVWDKSTFLKSIDKIFKNIHLLSFSRKPDKIRQKRELIKKYENILKRIFYDQTARDDDGNVVDPTDFQRQLDRITTQGLARMSEIFAGETSANYLWMNYGRSQITPELGDWRLYDELSTTSLTDAGYASGSGTIIKHGAAFSINDPSADDIYEFAIRDYPSFNEFQTVFFRSVLDEPVEHIQGQDVVIVAHAAYLVSVSDFEDQLNENVI